MNYFVACGKFQSYAIIYYYILKLYNEEKEIKHNLSADGPHRRGNASHGSYVSSGMNYFSLLEKKKRVGKKQ